MCTNLQNYFPQFCKPGPSAPLPRKTACTRPSGVPLFYRVCFWRARMASGQSARRAEVAGWPRVGKGAKHEQRCLGLPFRWFRTEWISGMTSSSSPNTPKQLACFSQKSSANKKPQRLKNSILCIAGRDKPDAAAAPVACPGRKNSRPFPAVRR